MQFRFGGVSADYINQKRSCLIDMNVPKTVGAGSDLANFDLVTDCCSLLKHQQTHASLDSPGRNYDRAEQKAQSLEKGRPGLRPNLLWDQRSRPWH